MGWKVPYEVTEKFSPLDYRIKTGNKEQTFHINILKQYIERENDDQYQQQNDRSQVCAVSLVELPAEEVKDECSDGIFKTTTHYEAEGNQVNINPALSRHQQNQIRLLAQEFSKTFSEKPGGDNSD